MEEFQGQERKVIVISTVHSSEQHIPFDAKHRLGFLKNPKRFNVAISRAKALLVVVGNPEVLAHDAHWRKLLELVLQKGSWAGAPPPRGLGGGGGAAGASDMDDMAAAMQRLICWAGAPRTTAAT